jgi:hypothetical protein
LPPDPEKSTTPPSGQEEDSPEPQAKPRCPNCGWQNVRISHNKNLLDTLLASALSVRRFKCRVCGHYFRHRYRVAE